MDVQRKKDFLLCQEHQLRIQLNFVASHKANFINLQLKPRYEIKQ